MRLPEFERAGVNEYFRSKRREEEKEKMDKQANSVLQDKLDSVIHGSVIVSPQTTNKCLTKTVVL